MKNISNLVILTTLCALGIGLELLTEKGLGQNVLVLFCVLGTAYILSNKMTEKKEESSLEKIKEQLIELNTKSETQAKELTAQVVASTQYLFQVGEGVSGLIQFLTGSNKPHVKGKESYVG